MVALQLTALLSRSLWGISISRTNAENQDIPFSHVLMHALYVIYTGDKDLWFICHNKTKAGSHNTIALLKKLTVAPFSYELIPALQLTKLGSITTTTIFRNNSTTLHH